jgi:uncharacterized membrane protein (DUF106 family)
MKKLQAELKEATKSLAKAAADKKAVKLLEAKLKQQQKDLEGSNQELAAANKKLLEAVKKG